MKHLIITVTALALCVQAQAEIGSLATTDGTTYSGITLQRAEPDGLYIEYTIPGGGIGMSKVKFDRLPGAQQKRYGYSVTDARDYEAAVAEANQDVAKELTERYEQQQNVRRERDAENQRAYAGRMAEMTRLNAALAAAFYHNTSAEPQGNRTFEYQSQFTGGRVSTETSFGPPATDLFPTRGYTTKAH